MGYYSNVAFAIEGKREDMITMLVTYRTTYSDPVEATTALNACCFAESGEFVTLIYKNDCTKWYDGFPDVRALTELFEIFQNAEDETEGKFNGKFIRIGEDNADVDEEYFGQDPHDMLTFERSIYMDLSYDETIPLEKLCVPTPPISSLT